MKKMVWWKIVRLMLAATVDQVVGGTDCSVNDSSSNLTRDTWLQVFSAQCRKVIALLAFFDAVTGATVFISLVNSVKIVNMP